MRTLIMIATLVTASGCAATVENGREVASYTWQLPVRESDDGLVLRTPFKVLNYEGSCATAQALAR